MIAAARGGSCDTDDADAKSQAMDIALPEGCIEDDVRLEQLERFLADAFDLAEVVERHEWAVVVAVGDDSLGERCANAGQLLQLYRVGRVDVDDEGRFAIA